MYLSNPWLVILCFLVDSIHCLCCFRHINEIVQEQIQVRVDLPLLNPVKAFKIGVRSVLGFCGLGPCLHRSDFPCDIEWGNHVGISIGKAFIFAILVDTMLA